MDGLFVDGRGGESAGFEDAVDGLLRNGARGERAAGVAGLEKGGEIHGGLMRLSSFKASYLHSRLDLQSFSCQSIRGPCHFS